MRCLRNGRVASSGTVKFHPSGFGIIGELGMLQILL